jgi:chromosome segregation ATPase
MDKIKRLDEQLKSRINEQKAARSKVSYKSVDDIDRQIAQFQKQVDAGTMKIVDERKALTEITQLNRAKKTFGTFDAAQRAIDDVKGQIAELKKTLDDPEAKAMSEKYNAIQKELDEIKGEQDEVYKNLNSLRDQRTQLQAEQQDAWHALKTFKDEYYEHKRAYRDYEQEAFRVRKEKQRAEREAYETAKRREHAAKRLEEASQPAYQDEIITAEGLIRYFDPSALPAKEASSPSKFAASAQRTVDDSAFKGMKVAKKDEEDYFIGSAGKKKKGGKKGGAAAANSASAETKFNLNIGVLEDLSKVKVDAPSSQADIPTVIEQLKEKVAKWKEDQDKKTQEVSKVYPCSSSAN